MSPRKAPHLSKSLYIAGSQCPLRLWHQCYNRELASELRPAQLAIFETSQEVGRLATHLYPEGILVEDDQWHHTEAAQATRAAINDPDIPAIFEAAFFNNDVRIRVDILERSGSGEWNLIEVKSATSVKDVYIADVADQFGVLRAAGLAIGRAGILHLDNNYVYDGELLALESLFTFADLTEEVLFLQQEISSKLAELKNILSKDNPPVVLPSRHCMSPYECEFWKHCTAEMPEFWVMGLTGIREGRLNELAALGVEDIRDIPESFPLTELQERIKTCVVTREEYIAPELEDELREVEYPIHFLDFETISPAIHAIRRQSPTRPFPFNGQITSFRKTVGWTTLDTLQEMTEIPEKILLQLYWKRWVRRAAYLLTQPTREE